MIKAITFVVVVGLVSAAVPAAATKRKKYCRENRCDRNKSNSSSGIGQCRLLTQPGASPPLIAALQNAHSMTSSARTP